MWIGIVADRGVTNQSGWFAILIRRADRRARSIQSAGFPVAVRMTLVSPEPSRRRIARERTRIDPIDDFRIRVSDSTR